MTVYERLKMELSNQQYLSEEQYNQLLAENDLVPSDNYVKSEMQKSLLFTVLDVLEAVANDIDVMSDISTEFTDIGQAYAFIEDRINNVKNKIAAIPDEDEEYSNFSLMYTNGQGMPRNTLGDNGNVDGISEEELDEKLEDYATKEYVDEVAENFVAGEVDLTNYATKEYVDGALENVNPNVDLTDYATKQYVDNGLNNKSNKNHTHNQYLTEHQSLAGYATENYVSTAIANAQLGGGEGGVDLSGYVTDDELSSALANKANKNHTHSEYLTEHQSLVGYATENYVNNAISNVELHGNGGGVEISKAEYNALSTAEKNNGTEYYVFDDEDEDNLTQYVVGNTTMTSETLNGYRIYKSVIKVNAYTESDTSYVVSNRIDLAIPSDATVLNVEPIWFKKENDKVMYVSSGNYAVTTTAITGQTTGYGVPSTFWDSINDKYTKNTRLVTLGTYSTQTTSGTITTPCLRVFRGANVKDNQILVIVTYVNANATEIGL